MKERYVKVTYKPGELPKAGVWLQVSGGDRPKVFAPCNCCGEWNDWYCDASQISPAGKKPVLPKNVIMGNKRRDGYRFFLTKKRGRVLVNAGCRRFTFDKARAHWKKTRGNTALGRWSLKEVARLRRLARRAGWIKAAR